MVIFFVFVFCSIYLQVKKNFCYFAQFLKDKICKYTFHNIRVLMNQ